MSHTILLIYLLGVYLLIVPTIGADDGSWSFHVRCACLAALAGSRMYYHEQMELAYLKTPLPADEFWVRVSEIRDEVMDELSYAPSGEGYAIDAFWALSEICRFSD